MIICHSRRFVFFSNPKTGSESVRKLLAEYSEERILPWRETSAAHPFYPHMAPREAARAFAQRGWDYFGYRRVTCVRNPYPRLVSLYRMIVETDGLWRAAARIGVGPPAFPAWLRRSRPVGRGGGGRPHQRWRRFGTWSAKHWCHDAAGTCLVTDILPLESLGNDLPVVLADLDVRPDVALPVLNARPTTDWRRWYDNKSRELVARRYAWDLKNFRFS